MFKFIIFLFDLGSFVADALTTEDDVPDEKLEEWAKTEASQLGLLK